jgi:pimeloyl-ACP methyl ester carboxylesterase
VNCYRGGAGPPQVLLHSGFCTWVEWRSTIEFLRDSRSVIAPTLPGSNGGPQLDLSGGRTMLAALADHVEVALDEAGWNEPVPIAGSSFGGVVALELAARGRASQVVALAPPWVAGAGLAFYAGLFPAPLAAARITERFHARLATSRAMALMMHGSRRPAAIEPDDVAEIWQSWGHFPFFRVGVANRLRGPGIPVFEQIRVPVTLVWGGADRLVPGWMRRRWEAALPDARIENLPGFPHVPHWRDPERIAGLLTQ